MASNWKFGRGKLGPLAPLVGKWRAEAESPMGPMICEREFATILGGKYLQLDAIWRFGKNSADGYRERAIFGPGADGTLSFWSFTSDGKRSEGRLVDAPDIHPKSVCFEAEMAAGIARQIYWPHETEGLSWAVEAKNKKGWRRFTNHHYHRVD